MVRPAWAQEWGVHSAALSGRIHFLVFLTQGFSTLGWIPSPFQGESKLTRFLRLGSGAFSRWNARSARVDARDCNVSGATGQRRGASQSMGKPLPAARIPRYECHVCTSFSARHFGRNPNLTLAPWFRHTSSASWSKFQIWGPRQQ